jgi:hypothetical protein
MTKLKVYFGISGPHIKLLQKLNFGTYQWIITCSLYEAHTELCKIFQQTKHLLLAWMIDVINIYNFLFGAFFCAVNI